MSEHTEQAAVIEWALTMEGQYPELKLLHAIPNGAKLSASRNRRGERYSREANHLINEGLKRGVPDLSLPVARGDWFGLYIEMKVKPNKPTPEQSEFIDRLNEYGYHAVVCYGADAAIKTLLDYLNLGPTYRTSRAPYMITTKPL